MTSPSFAHPMAWKKLRNLGNNGCLVEFSINSLLEVRVEWLDESVYLRSEAP